PGARAGVLAPAARRRGQGRPDAPRHPHAGKPAEEAPRVAPSRAKGARKPKLPVITIAQAKHKPDALAGLERWKVRYPDVAAQLAPEDILIDTNRGRATAWYRVRINLKNVPPAQHPPHE